jgi:hypothetical protein
MNCVWKLKGFFGADAGDAAVADPSSDAMLMRVDSGVGGRSKAAC